MLFSLRDFLKDSLNFHKKAKKALLEASPCGSAIGEQAA
jgi:hypothetical protein